MNESKERAVILGLTDKEYNLYKWLWNNVSFNPVKDIEDAGKNIYLAFVKGITKFNKVDDKIVEFCFEISDIEINKKLSNGWELYGTPKDQGYTQDSGQQSEHSPCQAMIRREKQYD